MKKKKICRKEKSTMQKKKKKTLLTIKRRKKMLSTIATIAYHLFALFITLAGCLLRITWSTVRWLVWATSVDTVLFLSIALFAIHWIMRSVQKVQKEKQRQQQQRQQHQQQAADAEYRRQLRTQQTRDKARRHARQRQSTPRLTPPTIDTWLHCQIGKSNRHGHFTEKTRVEGRVYKLVAHIDTGNSATTSLSAKMFDFLFPLQRGSQTKRVGVKYVGKVQIVGATGHVQTVPKYSGMKILFDGVKSHKGKRLQFTMDVTRRHDDNQYVPGAYGYHDLLVSSHDMKRLLDAHGHTIRVVDYQSFRSTCSCR